jgi:hypothetical protein
VRGSTRLALFELLLVAAGVGCHPEPRAHKPRSAPSARSTSSALTRVLAPRAASRFACQGDKCRQAQPRLPDTGEWRCAEFGHVVWCAGGEPAAGVVRGPSDPGYRCGPRWGSGNERVCIDQRPDYPESQSETFQCSFEQERGIARVCRTAHASPHADLAARALPACWLDRDCPSGGCDRGACRCSGPAECRAGRCEAGLCVEAKP